MASADRPLPPRRSQRSPLDEDEYGDDVERQLAQFRRRAATTPSGVVTLMAILDFLMGSMVLIGASCGGGMSLLFAAGIPALLEESLFFFLVFAAHGLWGIACFLAGIGVANRRAWGRALHLGTTAVGIVLGLGLLVAAIFLFKRIGDESGAFWFILFTGASLVMLAYNLFAYITLLRSKFAQEFS